MHSWLAKFRISTFLDSDKPLTPSLRRRIAASDDLRRFEQSVRGLDRALKEARPESKVSPFLHYSIMRAIARASRRPAVGNRRFLPRWVPVPALAGLALLVGGWLLRHATDPSDTERAEARPLGVLTIAFDMGNEIGQAVPSAVVAPMSDELARLNRDLDNTAQFLLASLP